MLGSDFILQALQILKTQFQDIGGLVDTILFQKDLSVKINSDLKVKKKLICYTYHRSYSIGSVNKHQPWLEDKWLVSDSLDNDTNLRSLRPAIIRICATHSNSKSRIQVGTVNVQKENGFSDCDLFALTYLAVFMARLT